MAGMFRPNNVVALMAITSMVLMLVASSPQHRFDDAIQPLATSATMCALLLAWFQTDTFGDCA
jgi:hypothetical protein